MARRPAAQAVSPAPRKQLTVEEMRRGIERLKERMSALEAFNPSRMTVEEPPEIAGMQVDLKGTLERIFGHDTSEYRRFEGASDLQWQASIFTGNYPALSDYQNGVREKIGHSLALLGQAVRFLEEEIADTEVVSVAPAPRLVPKNKVFVVHGHDDAAKYAVARFLEKIGLEAIILSEQPDQGRTIIEKFEDHASEVGFAVVLLTPDDVGQSRTVTDIQTRARQNVIFELGYFVGKLGRGRACLLRKGDVEMPSDLAGVIYTELDAADGWMHKLVRELKAARMQFDANRLWE